MSDELNSKERQLRDLLADMNIQPDIDQVWERLEPNLPQKEVKRRPVIWFLLATVLASVLMVALSEDENISHNMVQANEKTEKIRIASANEAKLVDESTKHKEASEIKANKLITKNTESDTEEKTVSNLDRPVEKSEFSRFRNHSSAGPNLSHSRFPSVSIDGHNLKNGTAEVQKTKNEDVNSTLKEPIFSESEKANAQVVNTSTRVLSTAVMLKSLSSSILHDRSLSSANVRYALLDNSPVVRNKNKAISFLQLRSGASLGNSTLTSSGEDQQKFLSNYQREVDKLGLSLGIDYGVHLGVWDLSAGLNYQQLASAYQRNETVISQSTSLGTTQIIIDENGNQQSFDGEVSTARSTTYDLLWHRKHTLVDAQIMLGRTLYRNGRLSLGIRAAVGYNIYSKHTGYFFNDDGSFQKFTSADTNPYRKNQGGHAAIMPDLSFHIRSVTLSILPTWRTYFNSLTRSDNNYKLKNSQLGMQIGITYRPTWK